jgi:hypothetical protein
MALKDLFKRGISALLKKQKKDVVDPSPVQRVQNQPKDILPEAPKGTALQTVKKDLAIMEYPTPPRTGALQMGTPSNQNLMFGSALYDRIAQKGPGTFTADEWMKFLTDVREKNIKIFGQNYREKVLNPVRFTYDNTSGYLAGKQTTVPLEELFDSNIAAFSPTGELTGGVLHAAKLAGVKIPGKVLTDLVRLNPVNRLQATEFSDSLSEPVRKRLFQKFKNTFDKINNQVNDPELSRVLNRYTDALERGIPSKPNFPLLMGRYPQFKKELQQLDFEFDDLERIRRNMKRPQYADQEGYTFRGGQDYRETVISLPEDIPGNNPKKFFGHYQDKGLENPIMHIRYDTRFAPNGDKILMIHEIQSDTNQRIAKSLRKAKIPSFDASARMNPYQKDTEIAFLLQARKKIGDKIISGNMARLESDQASRAIKSIDKVLVRKGIGKPETIKFTEDGTSYIERQQMNYYPLLDRSSYNNYAIKFLLNKAAKEKFDYVAVIPTNYMRRGIDRDKIKGTIENYGFASGANSEKGKSLAVIPAEMKKQAQLFDTTSGKIKFSLSDPNKPYKDVGLKDVELGDKTYKIKFHKDASATQQPGFRFIGKYDLNLYGDAYGVKVSPLMQQTQKLYKKEGGLVHYGG